MLLRGGDVVPQDGIPSAVPDRGSSDRPEWAEDAGRGTLRLRSCLRTLRKRRVKFRGFPPFARKKAKDGAPSLGWRVEGEAPGNDVSSSFLAR